MIYVKKPCESSPKINENFLKEGGAIELIGFVNGYFKVKSSEGKVGFVKCTYLPDIPLSESPRITQELQKKEILNAKIKNQKFLINGAFVSDVNSAGGVDISIEYAYLDNSKDIKYLYFTVIPYNSVGDVQSCRIDGHSEFTGKVTGPQSANDVIDTDYWSCAWYNSTISCLKLTKVRVEYLDGSSNTYINDLPKIMNLEYKCGCNL